MASSINASTAGAGGVITTADNSGILQVQTAGTTALTINAAQAATFAGAVSVSGLLTALTAASGTNTTQVATTAFAYGTLSIGTNGYVKLSNGLIIQWGTTVGISPVTQTLPITFPNAILAVPMITNGDFAASNLPCGSLGSSNSQIICGTTSVSAYRWSWIVFGY